ncbi:hypothetical protein OB13_12910, partial [Pontibacter sp. HJ8]
MDIDKKKDLGYAVVRAGLGSIPVFGAAAAELLQLIVIPPLEKRRAEWMTQIGEKLQVLEARGTINLEELRENDVFVDVV